MRPSYCTLEFLSQRNENLCSHKNLCTNVCSSFICNVLDGRQPKYSSTCKWLNKVYFIYTMEYYVAKKGTIINAHNINELQRHYVKIRKIIIISKVIYNMISALTSKELENHHCHTYKLNKLEINFFFFFLRSIRELR